MSRIGRWVALGLVGVALAGGGAFWWLRGNSKKGAGPGRFETAAIVQGDLQARITASGTVSPLISVQVGSQVSGRILELKADFNTPVTQGAVIARIDPQLYSAALEQARANLMVAKGNTSKADAQLEDAQRQAGRTRELFGKKLVSQADLDTAETALRIAQAQLVAAKGQQSQVEAALHQAEINLEYTTIRSPITGVVISRNVDVGQTVAASLSSPTLFVIAQDLTRMQVDTSVSEADVGRLKAGMSTQFTVDAYPNEPFPGKIREVRNAPQTVQNVVTYDAVIDVENPDLKLKPGMTANVTVVFADRTDVLKIPNSALRFRAPPDLLSKSQGMRPRGDQRMVWTLEAGEPKPVLIRVGVSDGAMSEITEGPLTAESLVITEASSGPRGGPGSFGRVF